MDHPMREHDLSLLTRVSGEEVMLHLLRCPHCRDMVLAQYGVQQAASAPPPGQDVRPRVRQTFRLRNLRSGALPWV